MSAEIISIREYSRRIGVSLPAVQKAARNGRIEVIRDAAGKITGIDWTTQEEAWLGNSKTPQRRPHNAGGGRPRKDGKPPAKSTAKSTAANSILETEEEPQDDEAGEQPVKASGMSLSQIQRARELVKLQLDNETLKKARGESVPVSQVKQEGAKLAAAVIAGMYNIPERCADDIAGMSDPHEIHALLVREIDAAVSELRRQYGVN